MQVRREKPEPICKRGRTQMCPNKMTGLHKSLNQINLLPKLEICYISLESIQSVPTNKVMGLQFWIRKMKNDFYNVLYYETGNLLSFRQESPNPNQVAACGKPLTQWFLSILPQDPLLRVIICLGYTYIYTYQKWCHQTKSDIMAG